MKILYQHPNHKTRYPKMREMSKDNGSNVIKPLKVRSIVIPTVRNKSIWDGLIFQHIESYDVHLEVRIDMFRQLRCNKERRDNIIRL